MSPCFRYVQRLFNYSLCIGQSGRLLRIGQQRFGNTSIRNYIYTRLFFPDDRSMYGGPAHSQATRMHAPPLLGDRLLRRLPSPFLKCTSFQSHPLNRIIILSEAGLLAELDEPFTDCVRQLDVQGCPCRYLPTSVLTYLPMPLDFDWRHGKGTRPWETGCNVDVQSRPWEFLLVSQQCSSNRWSCLTPCFR